MRRYESKNVFVFSSFYCIMIDCLFLSVPTLGARCFLLLLLLLLFFFSLGATEFEFSGEAAKASREAARKKKNLWHQRITTSLPCRRQFPLIDIRSQRKQSRQYNEPLIIQRMEFGTETKIKLAFG